MRLAERNTTPNTNILNNNLSIESRDGSFVIIPRGLLVCNFFSCNLTIKDCAADNPKIL